MESEDAEIETARGERMEEILPDKTLQEAYSIMASSSTSSSCSMESAISCRICKSSAGTDLICSPCLCKGSMGCVHVSCLEEWLRESTRETCELCSSPFPVVRTRRFGFLPSIWFFLSSRVCLENLFRDLFFFAVSLINTKIIFGRWCSSVFSDICNMFGEQNSDLETMMLDSPLRGIFHIFSLTSCLTFLSLNTAYELRHLIYGFALPWYTWWQNEVDIKLISEDERTGKKDQ